MKQKEEKAPFVFFILSNGVPKEEGMEQLNLFNCEMECFRGSSSAGADNPQFFNF